MTTLKLSALKKKKVTIKDNLKQGPGHFFYSTIISLMSNILLAGVTEVRILQMGSSEYYSGLVMEQCLIHDVDNIHAVNLKDLLLRENEATEVLLCCSDDMTARRGSTI